MKFFNYCALVAGILATVPASAATPVGITIDAARPGPVINKNIYGQFAEHLGTGIYGGLWVGRDSPIPNTRGWRNDVVGALKALRVPVVRWPGGCFADDYHWRDGVGPQAGRPAKNNNSWGGPETNAVGTDEFFDLVGQLGTEAYVNGNLRSGSAEEMADWIDYMTADGESTQGRLRAANGHPAPYKVAFFGVGNEAWGCGGNMTPEAYTKRYNEVQAYFKTRKTALPKMIASGGHDFDLSWTEHLSKHIEGKEVGIAFHYYTVPTGVWDKKGQATGFGEDQWFSTLQATLDMQGIVRRNLAQMAAQDPEGKFSLVVDEWGTWYDPAPGVSVPALQQQNTLRDAVLAGLNLNIFHDRADRVSMTSVAQMVNVLQAMVLTDKDKMVLTPTYHVFMMYRPFQDATSLPVALENNHFYRFGKDAIPALSVSAARARDGKLYLALVNTNPREAQEVTVRVAGAQAKAASGSLLTAAAIDAHNTFAAPRVVAPVAFRAAVRHGALSASVPAKSVVVLRIDE